MNRITKKLLYGIFYLAIIFGFIFLVYRLALKPAPTCMDGILNQNETGIDCGGVCQSCDIRFLSDITVAPKVLENPLDPQKSILYVELRNNNAGYGAKTFSYEVIFYDSLDQEILTYERETLIYPSERAYRVDLDVAVPFSQVARVLGVARNFVWQPIDQMSPPSTQIRDLQTRFDEERYRLIISGVIKNNNAFDIRRGVINALVPDSSGVIVGVSKAVVQDLTPLEDRSFEIFVPIAKNIPPETLTRPTLYTEISR